MEKKKWYDISVEDTVKILKIDGVKLIVKKESE